MTVPVGSWRKTKWWRCTPWSYPRAMPGSLSTTCSGSSTTTATDLLSSQWGRQSAMKECNVCLSRSSWLPPTWPPGGLWRRGWGGPSKCTTRTARGRLTDRRWRRLYQHCLNSMESARYVIIFCKGPAHYSWRFRNTPKKLPWGYSVSLMSTKQERSVRRTSSEAALLTTVSATPSLTLTSSSNKLFVILKCYVEQQIWEGAIW